MEKRVCRSNFPTSLKIGVESHSIHPTRWIYYIKANLTSASGHSSWIITLLGGLVEAMAGRAQAINNPLSNNNNYYNHSHTLLKKLTVCPYHLKTQESRFRRLKIKVGTQIRIVVLLLGAMRRIGIRRNLFQIQILNVSQKSPNLQRIVVKQRIVKHQKKNWRGSIKLFSHSEQAAMILQTLDWQSFVKSALETD